MCSDIAERTVFEHIYIKKLIANAYVRSTKAEKKVGQSMEFEAFPIQEWDPTCFAA